MDNQDKPGLTGSIDPNKHFHRNKRWTFNKPKPVIVTDLKTNEEKEFNSIGGAANYLEVFPADVHKALNAKVRHIKDHAVRYKELKDIKPNF